MTDTTQSLLPCPFCGDPMELIAGDIFRHTKENPDCPISTHAWQDSQRYVDGWNARPSPTQSPSQSLLEEAREIVANEIDAEALALFHSGSDLLGNALDARAEAVRAGNRDDCRDVRATLAALQSREELIGEMREAAQALVDGVAGLPVEDMVEQDRHGGPYLAGYCMQAQGEWDKACRAKDRLVEILDRLTTKEGDGE